jgi:hypothetical protein
MREAVNGLRCTVMNVMNYTSDRDYFALVVIDVTSYSIYYCDNSSFISCDS